MLVVIGIVALCLGMTTTLAQDDNTPVPEREVKSADEALAMDAQMYASDFGVSQEEAEHRLRLQASGAITELIVELEASAPDAFAGAWIENDPSYRIVARFATTETELAQAHELAANAPLPVTIIPDAPLSLSELFVQRDEMRHQVEAVFTGSGVGFDVQTGTIEFYVSPDAEGTEALDDLRAELESSYEAPVRFIIEDQVFRNAHLYGGHKLTRQSNGNNECTSGFSVVAYDWTPGILTAGHCNDDLRYHLGSSIWWMTFESEAWDSSNDIQWHSHGSATVYPEFVDGLGYRDLTGSALHGSPLNDIGSYVCNYGEFGGRGCGAVVDRYYAPPTGIFSDPCNGQLCDPVHIRMQGGSLQCAEGDSGGPVFIATIGLGVLKGFSSPTDCTYVPINNIFSIGVYMLTSDYGPIDP